MSSTVVGADVLQKVAVNQHLGIRDSVQGMAVDEGVQQKAVINSQQGHLDIALDTDLDAQKKVVIQPREGRLVFVAGMGHGAPLKVVINQYLCSLYFAPSMGANPNVQLEVAIES